MPVILTRVIDHVHRERLAIVDKYGEVRTRNTVLSFHDKFGYISVCSQILLPSHIKFSQEIVAKFSQEIVVKFSKKNCCKIVVKFSQEIEASGNRKVSSPIKVIGSVFLILLDVSYKLDKG